MPVTVALMDNGSWDLALDPATPQSVLDVLDPRYRLWASILITPHYIPTGEASTAELIALSRYRGVLLGAGQDRLSLDGEGLEWWLGGDGDGGNLYAGVDQKPIGSARDVEAWVTDIIANANGITPGAINTNATTYNVNREGGDTPRELLDTIARAAPSPGPYAWRLNNNLTLDVDTFANLWSTTNTPTVLLAEEGGLETAVTGLRCILDLDSIDGREVRTNVQVDWNDGTGNGDSSPTLPSTYRAPGGGAAVVRAMLDWKPKRAKPPTERWRKVAAWAAASQNRANKIAAAEANERAAIREEVTATLPDLVDPWRYAITPGNRVYLEDIARGLVNTANSVYYRGEDVHPTTGRVDEMTAGIDATYGKYLHYWDGAAFQILDLTPYALPEDNTVTLGINRRSRFPVRARARKVTVRQRRGWRAWALREKRRQQLEDFYEGL